MRATKKIIKIFHMARDTNKKDIENGERIENEKYKKSLST